MKDTTFIIIPVHNRCKTTFRCLKNLAEQGTPAWASIVIVDDGSTDGTSEMVRTNFPDMVLLRGDGSLWWCGAITFGMEFAVNAGAKHIIWLNDDCIPKAGTLQLMYETSLKLRCITVAQSFTPAGDVYGGYVKTPLRERFLPCKEGQILPCDTFSGNCVCIPVGVVKAIGFPNFKDLPQLYADLDFGLRAKNAGIDIRVLGSASCYNENNPALASESWLLDSTKLRQVWKTASSPKSSLYPRAVFEYRKSHWGALGVAVVIMYYARFFLFFTVRRFLPIQLRRRFFPKKRAVLFQQE